MTNSPIEGARLTIIYDTGSQLGSFLAYATADVNGLACTSISTGVIISISAYAPGYKAQNVLLPLPDTIWLFPVEKLKNRITIKNEKEKKYYNDKNKVGGLSIIFFDSSKVD